MFWLCWHVPHSAAVSCTRIPSTAAHTRRSVAESNIEPFFAVGVEDETHNAGILLLDALASALDAPTSQLTVRMR